MTMRSHPSLQTSWAIRLEILENVIKDHASYWSLLVNYLQSCLQICNITNDSWRTFAVSNVHSKIVSAHLTVHQKAQSAHQPAVSSFAIVARVLQLCRLAAMFAFRQGVAQDSGWNKTQEMSLWRHRSRVSRWFSGKISA